jgi:hypothetical protein
MTLLIRCVAPASLLLAAASVAAPAGAVELNGVWATDPALCDKIFTKKGNQVVFGPLSDLYGSGFIIDGNRLRGKVARCTVKSRTENGAEVTLKASCSTSVAVENVEFALRITDANAVTRIYPGMTGMEVNFHRCTL